MSVFSSSPPPPLPLFVVNKFICFQSYVCTKLKPEIGGKREEGRMDGRKKDQTNPNGKAMDAPSPILQKPYEFLNEFDIR